MLIVVVTPALYASIPCLTEIFDALTSENGVKIIPVLFENPLPRSKDQWTQVQADDLQAVEMLTRVQKRFGSLNCIPSPPGTVLEQPAVVGRVIAMVCEHLGKPAPSAPSSEPTHTTGVEELEVGGASVGGGGDGGGGARAFLAPLKLEKYAAAFDAEGAVDLGSLEGMTAQEFMNDFGMTRCVQGSDGTTTHL